MPTYTVHAPPAGVKASDPARFRFVRDGFYFWTFLLAVVILLGTGFYLIAAPRWLQAVGSLLLALLMGFEAGTLCRWTLRRRGWRTLGFVVGDNVESAERRFFAEWIKRAPGTPPQYAAPVRRGTPSGSDVIGLFPEAGQ